MSFDFTTINQPSNDPIMQFLASIMKQAQFKLAKDQADSLDDSEDIYSDSQDVEVKLSENVHLHNHVFRFVKQYYCPKDPGTLATVWYRGYNMGSVLRDFSHYNHKATINGEPILVDGTYDEGIFDESMMMKSMALRFNRPTSPSVGAEDLYTPDHTDLQITGIGAGNGFSIFFRVRLLSLAQEGGQDLTLCEKVDDSTPNYGYMIRFKNDGRIIFVVKRAGSVVANKETATGVAVANQILAGFATYAVTSDIVHIYTWVEPDSGTTPPTVTDRTLSNSADPVNFHTTLTDHGLNLFRRGVGSPGGHIYGDLYDWDFYRPDTISGHTGIVSSAEAGFRAINKHSISNIAFGCVAKSNHAAFVKPAHISSFTSTSFTATSFNT